MNHLKALSAVTFWTLAITLAAQADPGQWGEAIFVATVACVPTIWLMIDVAAAQVTRAMTEAVRAERAHTEELVLAVAVEFAQAELSHLSVRKQG